MHFIRQLNCWSLRCSWSIACRRCSNYIFIPNLTPGFNGLGKDNYKMRREAFKFWDLVRLIHDDVIKWKHNPRYWPFVRRIHQSLVNSPHKGQWRGALMLSLICDQINGWVNNRKAGDLRRYCAHCDVIVMIRDFTVVVVIRMIWNKD